MRGNSVIDLLTIKKQVNSEIRPCAVRKVPPGQAELLVRLQFGDKLKPVKTSIKLPPNLKGKVIGRPI
jgi:hypothetical protein